jgi:hypothetical protein
LLGLWGRSSRIGSYFTRETPFAHFTQRAASLVQPFICLTLSTYRHHFIFLSRQSILSSGFLPQKKQVLKKRKSFHFEWSYISWALV